MLQNAADPESQSFLRHYPYIISVRSVTCISSYKVFFPTGTQCLIKYIFLIFDIITHIYVRFILYFEILSVCSKITVYPAAYFSKLIYKRRTFFYYPRAVSAEFFISYVKH